MSEMTDEELPASPEYGFGGAAYARARKLKQKEMQAQAWHDANVGVPDELFALRASDDLKHAREVLSAYDQLVDTLRAENARLRTLAEDAGNFCVASDAENARLREALAGLVNRLDEIHDDPDYKTVWMVHQTHVGPYRGPTYTKELAAARAALKDAPQ